MSKEPANIDLRFRNILAFCILMNGHTTLDHSPDYILEKFVRYVGSIEAVKENDEWEYGLDGTNKTIYQQYVDRWFNRGS